MTKVRVSSVVDKKVLNRLDAIECKLSRSAKIDKAIQMYVRIVNNELISTKYMTAEKYAKTSIVLRILVWCVFALAVLGIVGFARMIIGVL